MYHDFLNEYASRFPYLSRVTLVTILMDEYEIDRRRAARAVASWVMANYCGMRSVNDE